MNQKTQSIPTGGIECFNMAKRYKVGKKSYNILAEIKALETRGSTIVFSNTQKPLAKVVSTYARSSADGTKNDDFESRDLIRKAALKSLQSNNNESHKMIALCGMGGVGKTTMMEHIKKDVEASLMFDRVVKVVLGENPDTIALQRAIAKYNYLEDLKEDAEDARADRLRSIFEGMSQQGKKVLVIMDDLWKVFDLKDVGLSPLPNGFKLLFTSRYKSVCTQMGVRNDSIFDVGFLNYEEAKTLFFRVVGISDGDDPSLQRIGEDIVKRCGGLPIAIVTIAKSLTDNIQEAWKKALRRLEEDDLTDLEGITHRIFEMSYENLKDDNDRAIFLLSALFPDDFDISTEDLLRLPRVIGKLKKLKLLDLSGCDDLRIDEGVFENLAGLEELYLKSYYNSPIRFTKNNCEELEILSHGLFALEVELFKNMVKPQNMSFKNLERFKISIGCKLNNFIYGQSNALTNTIQLVGDCNELSECNINEIFNKTEGHYLQVNKMNHFEDILTNHQDPFSNLTVLHVSKYADLTCLFTVDVASGLKKLERLIIFDCPVMRTLVAVENGMVGAVRLQKLNFMSLSGLPELESFCDNVIELPEIVEFILGDLPKFPSIYPHVHNTSEMQSLLNKKVAIPRLERLYVSRMENLKHIWPRETVDENINASMLRFISVEECKNLRNLFPLNPLPLLKHLEELVVKECHSIEVLFNMELESNNNYNSRLRSIVVHNLGSLKELWRMKNVDFECELDGSLKDMCKKKLVEY
ncbi:hypothetical protein E3N88_02065 [Mikania micrantha]|uniref:AAA+ ATPase domain-containing protein n=1 Tax=Mikania micrantha TaxID=192012 RepID=A0A5N6Q2Z8_9ASTR|nr:hypothetical protein E3N88_02065 [Mikania micrantha]